MEPASVGRERRRSEMELGMQLSRGAAVSGIGVDGELRVGGAHQPPRELPGGGPVRARERHRPIQLLIRPAVEIVRIVRRVARSENDRLGVFTHDVAANHIAVAGGHADAESAVGPELVPPRRPDPAHDVSGAAVEPQPVERVAGDLVAVEQRAGGRGVGQHDAVAEVGAHHVLRDLRAEHAAGEADTGARVRAVDLIGGVAADQILRHRTAGESRSEQLDPRAAVAGDHVVLQRVEVGVVPDQDAGLAVADRARARREPDEVAAHQVLVRAGAGDVDAHLAVARDRVAERCRPAHVGQLRPPEERHAAPVVGQGLRPGCVQADEVGVDRSAVGAATADVDPVLGVAGDLIAEAGRGADAVALGASGHEHAMTDVAAVESTGRIDADQVGVDGVAVAPDAVDAHARSAVGRDDISRDQVLTRSGFDPYAVAAVSRLGRVRSEADPVAAHEVRVAVVRKPQPGVDVESHEVAFAPRSAADLVAVGSRVQHDPLAVRLGQPQSGRIRQADEVAQDLVVARFAANEQEAGAAVAGEPVAARRIGAADDVAAGVDEGEAPGVVAVRAARVGRRPADAVAFEAVQRPNPCRRPDSPRRRSPTGRCRGFRSRGPRRLRSGS